MAALTKKQESAIKSLHVWALICGRTAELESIERTRLSEGAHCAHVVAEYIRRTDIARNAMNEARARLGI